MKGHGALANRFLVYFLVQPTPPPPTTILSCFSVVFFLRILHSRLYQTIAKEADERDGNER